VACLPKTRAAKIVVPTIPTPKTFVMIAANTLVAVVATNLSDNILDPSGLRVPHFDEH